MKDYKLKYQRELQSADDKKFLRKIKRHIEKAVRQLGKRLARRGAENDRE